MGYNNHSRVNHYHRTVVAGKTSNKGGAPLSLREQRLKQDKQK